MDQPRARVAPEFPSQAQQTQQHAREEEPLKSLYADLGIRVLEAACAARFRRVLDEFADCTGVRQRRCRHVPALGARRKILQGRRREPGEDRILFLVQHLPAFLIRDERALLRTEANADHMNVAAEQIGDSGLEPRLGVLAVGQHDEIAVAVVTLAEAFQGRSQHAVIVGTPHGHIVRIEGRQKLADDLIVRAHGNLDERGSGEHHQADVLSPQAVQQPLDSRLRGPQPRSLVRHVLGPHAARQIQCDHDLDALAEGQLRLLAPLRAGERDDTQGNGPHDEVRGV